jgi:hypothetical protein
MSLRFSRMLRSVLQPSAQQRLGLVCALLVVGAGSTGCVTASVEHLRQAPSVAVTNGEAVVVLGRDEPSGYQTEAEFTQCVAESLKGAALTIYPQQRFINQLFPWFEPRIAPMTTDALQRLLADPVIAQRLRSTNVRYIVWMDGATRDAGNGGAMSCAVGPGGGACLGFLWWEEEAAYEASVWDLSDVQSIGKVSIDANGTSYMPAVILPLPLMARTQAVACHNVADALREFLKPRSR